MSKSHGEEARGYLPWFVSSLWSSTSAPLSPSNHPSSTKQTPQTMVKIDVVIETASDSIVRQVELPPITPIHSTCGPDTVLPYGLCLERLKEFISHCHYFSPTQVDTHGNPGGLDVGINRSISSGMEEPRPDMEKLAELSPSYYEPARWPPPDDDLDKVTSEEITSRGFSARVRKRTRYDWRAKNLPWRLGVGGIVSLWLVPGVYSIWTLSKGFRVASGVTSTLMGMAVVPLRTADHVPKVACIVTYAVWALCFATYVGLQLLHIPHHPRDKRTIYIFTVAMVSLHFTVAVSQGSDSIIEGFALFGPIVSTASAYLMSLFVTINWRETGPMAYELPGTAV
ncbi:hypothetical protein NM208_g12218 [Fusarium decemcellulare]|uniref:Uncharacterized protein n=1 Tax=Fusarium decemcellulare TaxID=57161 RepID=A0ACC1RRB0_9HYPO|nr:hypothetical protein NM208_g12218 [Fusarium decemcellulare]